MNPSCKTCEIQTMYFTEKNERSYKYCKQQKSKKKLGKPSKENTIASKPKSSFFMASNAPHKRDAKRSARDFVTGQFQILNFKRCKH